MFNVSLGFAAWLCQECSLRRISIENPPPPWARKFFLVGAQISSLKLTLQRYDIRIAVHEYRQ